MQSKRNDGQILPSGMPYYQPLCAYIIHFAWGVLTRPVSQEEDSLPSFDSKSLCQRTIKVKRQINKYYKCIWHNTGIQSYSGVSLKQYKYRYKTDKDEQTDGRTNRANPVYPLISLWGYDLYTGFLTSNVELTHCCHVTPCVSEVWHHGIGNGLSPAECWAITWTNYDVLPIAFGEKLQWNLN